jgi:hypothetical protein
LVGPTGFDVASGAGLTRLARVLGLFFLAVCVAAIFPTSGTLRIVAIVAAVVNVVSYLFAQPPVGPQRRGLRRRAMQIPTAPATALTALTGVISLVLLVYTLGFAPE